MVSPVLGQAMRTPEQLPALEETKARGPIPRMSRASMSALKVFLAHSMVKKIPAHAPGPWTTQLATRQTASSLVKGQEKVLRSFLITYAASSQPRIPSPPSPT